MRLWEIAIRVGNFVVRTLQKLAVDKSVNCLQFNIHICVLKLVAALLNAVRKANLF
jgi:hypothetical protein